MQEGEKQYVVIFRWGLGRFWGCMLAGVNPLDKIIRGAVVDQKSRPLNISVAQGFISNSGQNWLPRE